MHTIKLVYIIGLISFVILAFSIDKITSYLEKKPKEHRLRKFWSRNVVDLDNLYE